MSIPKTGESKVLTKHITMEQVEKDMTAETNRLRVGYIRGKSGEVKSKPVGSFAHHRE